MAISNHELRPPHFRVDDPFGEMGGKNDEQDSEPPEPTVVDYGLTFGQALDFLKIGGKLARAGWNGKNMWIIYSPGWPDGVQLKEGSPYYAAGLRNVVIDPHIDMMTAGGSMQPGWLASQADMNASDWGLIPQ